MKLRPTKQPAVLEDRRDFNAAEQALIRRGRTDEAKAAWTERNRAGILAGRFK